jgi:transcriptional regulator with XRE-family HTH domain
MAADHVSIGERIAITRRRRGMTQAVLAGQLGRSVQWLSMIERGVRRADRYSILVPIADVLGVPVAELTRDAPVESSRADVQQHGAGQAVRLALSGHTFTATAGELIGGDNLAELRERVRCAWALVHEAGYGELGLLVPELIEQCERAAWTCAPDRCADAFRLLAELYQAVAAMMAKLGESDAAWVAGDRSAFAAARANDPVLAAAGGYRLSHAFMSAGKLEQAERAADVAAGALERHPHGECADVVGLWGSLHLVKAVVAARRGDADAAWLAMSRAQDAARELGADYEDSMFDTEFGQQNVAVHAVSVAVELGDAAEALRRANGVDVGRLSSERRARLLVDVARAHAQQRKGAAAIQALEEAELLAPELVRCHWLARETVLDLLQRQRGRTKPGRVDLAGRMGLV